MIQIKRYFSIATTKESVDIIIYGDITSVEWIESDTSSYSLAKLIKDADVLQINVHINSYGGEVAEGLAIYNALKNHPAKVVTYCDGFACSAASVVFMAGDERIMMPASLLMIHNAWLYAAGNANELRKVADDLQTISETAANAYKERISISDEELAELLDNETWIAPPDAVEMGFATSIHEADASGAASQNVRSIIFSKLTQQDDQNVSSSQGIAEGFFTDPNLETFRKMMEDLGLLVVKQESEPTKPEEPTQTQKTFFNFGKEKHL